MKKHHCTYIYICVCMHINVCVCSVTQSSPTLCDMWALTHQAPLSMELFKQEYFSSSGLPFSSSRGSSWLGYQTSISCVSCIIRQILYQWLPGKAHIYVFMCVYISILDGIICMYNLEYLKICLTVVTQVYAVSSIFLKHSLANLLWED